MAWSLTPVSFPQLISNPLVSQYDTREIVNRDRTALDEEGLAFAYALFCGVLGAQSSLDEAISKAAKHWSIDRMISVDRCILRLAAYELLNHPGTPPKVVINEAIEIARDFSADDSSRFINGVLDKIKENAVGGAKPKVRRKKSDGAKKSS